MAVARSATRECVLLGRARGDSRRSADGRLETFTTLDSTTTQQAIRAINHARAGFRHTNLIAFEVAVSIRRDSISALGRSASLKSLGVK